MSTLDGKFLTRMLSLTVQLIPVTTSIIAYTESIPTEVLKSKLLTDATPVLIIVSFGEAAAFLIDQLYVLIPLSVIPILIASA